MSRLNSVEVFQPVRRRLRRLRVQFRERQQNRYQSRDQLRDQLRDVEQNRDQLRDQLRDVQQNRDQLRDQLRDVQQNRDQLSDQLRDVQQNRDQLSDQLRDVQQNRDQLRDQLRDVQQNRHQLRELQQNRDLSHDWVINRKHIQITDQELGRGAWGVVYKGRFNGCEVAVKQMYDAILSDRNMRLFEREVYIASKCRHPCLLQFIGATADDQTPLLVTELMECSLRERLFSITVEDVAVISLDVARALNYLHQKSRPIIHHDVSSANVLLRRQRDQWQAKLSDYGTANFVSESNINYAGALIYCAPESRREDPDRPISVKVGNDTSSF